MPDNNNKRLIIVTGGTRGIGFAIAERLAEQGYSLALWFSARPPADAVVSSLMALGAESVICQQVDVADRSAVVAALSEIRSLPCHIYGLVNNAGILQQKPFEIITDQDWDQMLAVNLKGAFICSQEVMPLLRCNHGCIINIASSGGQLGGTLAVHYAVSKAGIIALTKSLARVGALDQIRVNCVSPGLIDTEMTGAEIASPSGQQKIAEYIPLHRVGQPCEVADAVSYLLSDRAGYITGQTLNVNGGLYMG